MTKEGLEELLHLAQRALGEGRVGSISSWYHRGRSIYETTDEGERKVASVEGPKTRSRKDRLAALAESRAAFIAAFSPVAAKELVEESIQRTRMLMEAGPRELTNLLQTTHDARTALEDELNHTLDCGFCGHCEMCQSLRGDHSRFDG